MARQMGSKYLGFSAITIWVGGVVKRLYFWPSLGGCAIAEPGEAEDYQQECSKADGLRFSIHKSFQKIYVHIVDTQYGLEASTGGAVSVV